MEFLRGTLRSTAAATAAVAEAAPEHRVAGVQISQRPASRFSPKYSNSMNFLLLFYSICFRHFISSILMCLELQKTPEIASRGGSRSRHPECFLPPGADTGKLELPLLLFCLLIIYLKLFKVLKALLGFLGASLPLNGLRCNPCKTRQLQQQQDLLQQHPVLLPTLGCCSTQRMGLQLREQGPPQGPLWGPVEGSAARHRPPRLRDSRGPLQPLNGAPQTS